MNLKNLLLVMDFQVTRAEPKEVCTQPLKVVGGVGDQSEALSLQQRKVFTLVRVSLCFARTQVAFHKE